MVGPLGLLVAAGLGITAGERVAPGRAGGGLVVGGLMVGGALVVRLAARDPVATRRTVGAFLLAALGVAVVAGAQARAARTGQVTGPLVAAVAERASATVRVTLVGDPTATRFAARALARVDRSCPGGGPCVGVDRIVVVDATGAAATRLAATGAGDRLVLRGSYRPLDRFEAASRWRHAVGAFAADDLVSFRGPAGLLLRTAAAVRAVVGRGLRTLPEPERTLVRGFLLGGSTGLPADVVADFRAAGLSHLVVVSGENVAFVLVLVGPVLRRLPRRSRLGAALVVLVVFAATTRFEPSVLRAAGMAACALVARSTGRPTAGPRVLALAVTGLLVADPFLLHSVGFRLSVAATAGIAVAARPVAGRLPGPRVLADAVGVAVGAQVGVAPILVATFGSVPLITLPANLVAAPFVGPLTVSGLAGALVGGAVPARVVGAVLGFPAWACGGAILEIAHVAARFPVPVGPGELGLLALGGVTVVVVRRRRRATWPGAPAHRPGAPDVPSR